MIATEGSVGVKSVNLNATIDKVGVHKFDNSTKCTLQFGDPDGRNVPGITFRAEVNLVLIPGVPGKPDWGILKFIQNVNYTYRRTPPLHPDPTGKRQHECASSKGVWQLDGTDPYQGSVRVCSIGFNYLPDGSTPNPVDSPGVFLEEDHPPIAFEDVEADDRFRTYLIWQVGGKLTWSKGGKGRKRVSSITGGVEHVLGRIDWSWKGRAIQIGAQTGNCSSNNLKDKNWTLFGKPLVPKPQVVIGAPAGGPVMAPLADPNHWELC